MVLHPGSIEGHVRGPLPPQANPRGQATRGTSGNKGGTSYQHLLKLFKQLHFDFSKCNVYTVDIRIVRDTYGTTHFCLPPPDPGNQNCCALGPRTVVLNSLGGYNAQDSLRTAAPVSISSVCPLEIDTHPPSILAVGQERQPPPHQAWRGALPSPAAAHADGCPCMLCTPFTRCA